jgi:replicative DNA helicase
VKTLLRSTIVCRPEDSRDKFRENYQALLNSGLGFEIVEDNVIWQYVQDFVGQHHHMPDVSTVQSHFSHLREDEVTDRLSNLAVLPSRTGGDFLRILEEKVDERKTRQVIEILKDASRIVQGSVTIKEGKEERILKGPIDAVKYIMDQGHDIVTPSTGVRLYGDATADGDDVKAEYERVEADPLAGIGQFTGITQIDSVIKGAKRQELWLHAAFTGGLKSTFALNWSYNQAVYYGHSSVFFSLEMPYRQCRRLLYGFHSAHEKFTDIRRRLGIGRSLAYKRIRDGDLDHYTEDEIARMSPEDKEKLLPDAEGVKCINPARPEKRFLFEYVIPDFNDPKNDYGSIHIEVRDPDKPEYRVADIRNRAEVLYAKDPGIRSMYIDHALLVDPKRWVPSTTERLNEVLKDLKAMSMAFNRGMGIAVIALFQISRKGFESAEKNDGRYNLTHLSYANEAERSSDVVTATFIDDDLRARSAVRFQCLKTRDDEPFESFLAGVLWPCRRLFTTHDVTEEEAKAAGDDIDRDMLADDD